MARDPNLSTERNHEHDRIKEHDIMKHGNHEQQNRGYDQGVSGGGGCQWVSCLLGF